jgi:tRNA pseudouridine13 synthase
MKDRHAVTRQWLSFPDVDPNVASTFSTPELRVLTAARHGNKLKTGHLHGNRFTLTLRGTCDDAVARARAIVDALVTTGLPNRYGSQRFGARGDNASRGRALVAGEPSRRPVSRSERRLLVSAFQSELFNAYLEQRIADGLLRTAIGGDVLRKRETGGMFIANEGELAEAQARLDAGALDVTGPMVGHKMMSPPEGTANAAREDALLAGVSITRAQLATLGPIAEGTRRPLTVAIDDAAVEAGPTPDSLVVRFTLPAGAYATVLADEVIKAQ